MRRLFYSIVFGLVFCINAYSQTHKGDSVARKYFIGSTFFMLGNLSKTNTPDFIQLNLGHRLNSKNVLSVELKTWKYSWPIGIPFGKYWENPNEKYPGYVREFGIAIVYQYFYWKNAFISIDAMNGLQKYSDENGNFIQNGYILFMTYRLGYSFNFFKNRLFLQPSVAMTYWPINTNAPRAFAELDKKWPNYFLFEPGLHFGVNF